MDKSKIKKFTWDDYLKPEIKAHFYERNEPTPREWQLIHLVVDDEPITKAPFEIKDVDRQFFEKIKKEYEARKKLHPNEEIGFGYAE